MVRAGRHMQLRNGFEVSLTTPAMEARVIQPHHRDDLLCQLLFCAPL